jgi:hypothetical protein
MDGQINKFTTINDYTILSDKDIQIFPNPTDNYFQISTSDDTILENTVIYIIDINGAKAHAQSIEKNNTFVNIQHLPKGIYYAQILKENNVLKVQKIIKM